MRIMMFLVVSLIAVPLPSAIDDDRLIFRRGDSNHDGTVDGSDVSYTSSWLFQGGPAPPCLNEADANHDGSVNVSDPVYTSNWLYQGGPEPPAPGPFASSCSESAAPWISCQATCSTL